MDSKNSQKWRNKFEIEKVKINLLQKRKKQRKIKYHNRFENMSSFSPISGIHESQLYPISVEENQFDQDYSNTEAIDLMNQLDLSDSFSVRLLWQNSCQKNIKNKFSRFKSLHKKAT